MSNLIAVPRDPRALTLDEIAALPAGRELDAFVAEVLFGKRWARKVPFGKYILAGDLASYSAALKVGGRPSTDADLAGDWAREIHHYSTSMSCLLVVEAMQSKGFWARIETPCAPEEFFPVPEYEFFAGFAPHGTETLAYAKAATMPLAVCRAALLTCLNPF